MSIIRHWYIAWGLIRTQGEVLRQSTILNQGVSKRNCLHDGWITSGSAKVVCMAFNFYNNGTPSVYDYNEAEEQLFHTEILPGLFS